MKKVMLVVLAMVALSCRDAGAEIDVYDYVNINGLKTISFENNVLSMTLSGQASWQEDGPTEITVTGRLDSGNLTLSTGNFKRVHTYRLSKQLLERIFQLHSDLSGE